MKGRFHVEMKLSMFFSFLKEHAQYPENVLYRISTLPWHIRVGDAGSMQSLFSIDSVKNDS